MSAQFATSGSREGKPDYPISDPRVNSPSTCLAEIRLESILTCNSDVLFRHNKLHTQQVTEGQAANYAETSETTQRSPSNGTTISGLEQVNSHGSEPLNGGQNSQHQIYLDPTLDPSLDTSSHSLRHMSMPDISVGYTPSDAFPTPSLPQSNSEHLTNRNSYIAKVESPTSGNRPRAGTTSLIPARPDTMSSENMVVQSGLLNNPFASPLNLNDPHSNSSDMLHFWLSQADNSMGYGGMSLSDVNGTSYQHMGNDFGIDLHHDDSMVSQPNDASPTEPIPTERFYRVENSWLSESSKVHRLVPDLWQNIAKITTPNVFSESMGPPSITPSGNGGGNRWNISWDLAHRLEAEFGIQPSTTTGKQNDNMAFPPPEVLDICLDMYFRHFQPMGPFMHRATFDAATTPLPLLYAMCLLGLSALGTGGGKGYIKQAFMV